MKIIFFHHTFSSYANLSPLKFYSLRICHFTPYWWVNKYIVTQYSDYRVENYIIYWIILLFSVFAWGGGGELFMCLIQISFERAHRIGLNQYLPNFTQYSKRQSGVKKDIPGSLPYKDDIKTQLLYKLRYTSNILHVRTYFHNQVICLKLWFLENEMSTPNRNYLHS